MTSTIALGMSMGTAIARCLCRQLLGERFAGDVGQGLIDQLQEHFKSRRSASTAAKRIKTIGVSIAKELMTLLEAEHSCLSAGGKHAVVREFLNALEKANVDSSLLAKQRLDVPALEEHILSQSPNATRDLSQAESEAYRMMIHGTAQRIVAIASELPEFAERTTAEALKLLSHVMARTDSILGGITKLQNDVSKLREDLGKTIGDPDTVIDAAKGLMFSGQEIVAIDRLEQFKTRSWHLLIPHHRFRLLNNLGIAHLLQGEHDDAARIFMLAIEHESGTEQACLAEIRAHGLMGHDAQALELAEKARTLFPGSAEALQQWLLHAPDTMRLDELESAVPVHLQQDLVILNALSLRARDCGAYEKAEQYARQALSVAKENEGQALHDLALILLQAETATARHMRGKLPLRDTAGKLTNAVTSLTRALKIIGSNGPPKRVAALRTNRAVASRLLGRDDEALIDLHAAYELHPESEEVVLSLALCLRDNNQTEKALNVLSRSIEQRPTSRVALLYASILDARKNDSDRRKAIGILNAAIGMQNSHPGLLGQLAEYLMDLHCQINESGKALNVIESVREKLSDFQHARLCCAYYGRRGALDEAKDWARRAMLLDWGGGELHDKRCFAMHLTLLKMYREALEVWKAIVLPDCIGSDLYALLKCAEEVEDYECIRSTCKALRDNGYIDDHCFALELNTLIKFNCVQEAIDAMKSALTNPPHEEFVPQTRLWLSMTGVRLGRPDLIESDVERLPSLDSVNAPMGAAVVHVLLQSNPLQAATYAYGLYRRFPNEEESNQALIVSVAFNQACAISPLDTVRPGAAVRYRDADDDREHVCIIEDCLQPAPDIIRGEVSSEHHLAKALAGSAVGQRVKLAADQVQPRWVEIVEIVDKRILRCRECLDNYPDRFPTSGFIRRFHVAGKGTDTFDFSSIIRAMEERGDHLKSLEDRFREQIYCPIYLFGKLAGGSVLDAIIHVSHAPRLELRCCRGSAEEQQAAKVALQLGSSIVIDESALLTLILVDKVDVLSQVPLRITVSQGTEIALRSQRQKLKDRGETLSVVNGKLVLGQWSAAERQVVVDRFDAVIGMIGKHLYVLESFGLARLAAEPRDTMITVFGQAGAESIELARQGGSVLWTDDFATAEYARAQFKIQRTWTQMAFQWLLQTKRLKAEDYYTASVELASWRYNFTSFSVDIITHALDAAEWEVGNPRVGVLLDHCANERVGLDSLHNLLLGLLPIIWLKCPNVAKADAITMAFLERLARRSGGESLLRHLYNNLPSVYGLDVNAVVRTQSIIESILTTRTNRIVLASPFDLLQLPRPPM